MPRRRFRRSRGCGALRVGSAWRLERIIFALLCHAAESRTPRRGLLRFSDCATWLIASTRLDVKSGVPAVTRATHGQREALYYGALLVSVFGLLVSYMPLGQCGGRGKDCLLLRCTRLVSDS